MKEAISQSIKGMEKGDGGPFGALVIKDGNIISVGNNQVIASNDPTAHAEMVAIRKACKKLGSFQLSGCELYTSCEPCPMCLGAIYWARLDKVYYAGTRKDAAEAGFDDQFIYDEIEMPLDKRKIPMVPLMRNEALTAFKEWKDKEDKKVY